MSLATKIDKNYGNGRCDGVKKQESACIHKEGESLEIRKE